MPKLRHRRRAALATAVALLMLVGLNGSSPRDSAGAATSAGVPNGVQLSRSGQIVVKTNGAVIDARDVHGSIIVRANNVRITRTRVSNGDNYAIRLYDGFSGLVIEDSEVVCTNKKTNGIAFGNYVARRVEITGCKNSFMQSAGSTEIYDSVVDGKATGIQTDNRPAPATDNLLYGNRADFDTSTGGWRAQGNTTVSHNSKIGRTQAGSLRIDVDRDGPWPDKTRSARAGTAWGTNAVQASPGSAYIGGLWIRPAGSPSPVRCELRFFRANGSIISTVEGTLEQEAADDWNLRLCAGVAPADAGFVNLRVYIADADYGDIHFVDDARLARFGAATPSRPTATTSTTVPAATTPPTTTKPAPVTTTTKPAPVTTTTKPAPVTTTTKPAPPPPPPPSSGLHGTNVGAHNTGVPSGTSLTPSGSITITTPGTVISNLDVNGSITVKANNVTIRNTRVRYSGTAYAVNIPWGVSGVVLEDVEIDGTQSGDGQGDGAKGICCAGYTLRRADVHGFQSGAQLESNAAIEYSWFHNNRHPGGNAHQSGLGTNGGSNLVIRGNNIDACSPQASSALSMYGDFGKVENALVEKNLFNTCGSYCTYAGSVPSKPYPKASNVRYLNNAFGNRYYPTCGIYGAVTSWSGGSGNQWSGNYWQATGAPVNP